MINLTSELYSYGSMICVPKLIEHNGDRQMGGWMDRQTQLPFIFRLLLVDYRCLELCTNS